MKRLVKFVSVIGVVVMLSVMVGMAGTARAGWGWNGRRVKLQFKNMSVRWVTVKGTNQNGKEVTWEWKSGYPYGEYEPILYAENQDEWWWKGVLLISFSWHGGDGRFVDQCRISGTELNIIGGDRIIEFDKGQGGWWIGGKCPNIHYPKSNNEDPVQPPVQPNEDPVQDNPSLRITSADPIEDPVQPNEDPVQRNPSVNAPSNVQETSKFLFEGQNFSPSGTVTIYGQGSQGKFSDEIQTDENGNFWYSTRARFCSIQVENGKSRKPIFMSQMYTFTDNSTGKVIRIAVNVQCNR